MKSLLTLKLFPNRFIDRVSENRGCHKREVNRFGLSAEIHQRSLGFTLIELMVIIAIIGILAGIGIPAYRSYLYKAKVVAAVAELKDINTAIEAYRAGNDELPPDLASIDYDNLLDPRGNPYQYENLMPGGAASLGPSFASAKGSAKALTA